MKAVRVYEPGGPEKLIYEDVPTPVVKPGWSLVKVMGFGINHSEIFTRQGLSPSVQFPRILGIECVGQICDTEATSGFQAGDKVISIMGEMGRAFDGGYAAYVLLPNEQIYPIATNLPWESLAALPETYYTAFGSMKNLRLRAGDRVFVRGATSGVGLAFCRLAKAFDKSIQVTGSCRNLAKEDQLLEYGFDQVICDNKGILETEESFDKVLELIGPATLKDTCAHVKEDGIICSTGQLGGQWYINDFDPITELPPNGYLTSFYSANVDGKKLQELVDFVEKYKVNVKPEKIFRLDELREAHEYLEGKQSFGKVIVLNE